MVSYKHYKFTDIDLRLLRAMNELHDKTVRKGTPGIEISERDFLKSFFPDISVEDVKIAYGNLYCLECFNDPNANPMVSGMTAGYYPLSILGEQILYEADYIKPCVLP